MRTFPIFVSVDRKPPLVVGGGGLAAIKARLLLKRAPSVDIAADHIVPELAELLRARRVAVMPQPGTMTRIPALPRSHEHLACPSTFQTAPRCAASLCRPSWIVAT